MSKKQTPPTPVTSLALVPAEPVLEKLNEITDEIRSLKQNLSEETSATAVWATQAQFAKRYGMSKSTVHRLITEGVIKKKIQVMSPSAGEKRKTYRYPIQEVDNYFKTHGQDE